MVCFLWMFLFRVNKVRFYRVWAQQNNNQWHSACTCICTKSQRWWLSTETKCSDISDLHDDLKLYLESFGEFYFSSSTSTPNNIPAAGDKRDLNFPVPSTVWKNAWFWCFPDDTMLLALPIYWKLQPPPATWCTCVRIFVHYYQD